MFGQKHNAFAISRVYKIDVPKAESALGGYAVLSAVSERVTDSFITPLYLSLALFSLFPKCTAKM